MQVQTGGIAALAVDEEDTELAWEFRINSASIFISAATRELYPDEVSAWEGAHNLWRAILGFGFELADEGPSEIGVIRRPGHMWRGKVVMIVKSVEA